MGTAREFCIFIQLLFEQVNKPQVQYPIQDSYWKLLIIKAFHHHSF